MVAGNTPHHTNHIKTYHISRSYFHFYNLLQQTPTMTMLNKITTFLLVLVAAATNLATTSTAFTTTQSLAVLRQGDHAASRHSNPAAIGPSTFQVTTNSHSALQLKVKVDPDAKKTKNTAGNAKMAAYGGSVVIALLLPIAFLVWSAVSK